tara:strand:+ start:262 stop:615 length:354 start_codon:yes stop_codon:yes gene_type:complete
MSNSETVIQQEIRLAVGREPHLRLFRNQVGQLPDPNSGRYVQFGLAKGSSDLIGFKTIEITPDMVGQKIAQFVSIEVKTAKGRPTPQQKNWLNCVASAGGISGIARSPEDAKKILEL